MQFYQRYMVPIADQFSTTTTTKTTTTTIMASTLRLHTQVTFMQSRKLMAAQHLLISVYQQTTIGSSDVLIQTLVPVAISTAPYRKALITKNLPPYPPPPLTDTPYISFSNLMTTVASSFSWTRIPLKGRQKPLLQLFVLISFSLLICRALDLQTLLGSLLQSQT